MKHRDDIQKVLEQYPHLRECFKEEMLRENEYNVQAGNCNFDFLRNGSFQGNMSIRAHGSLAGKGLYMHSGLIVVRDEKGYHVVVPKVLAKERGLRPVNFKEVMGVEEEEINTGVDYVVFPPIVVSHPLYLR